MRFLVADVVSAVDSEGEHEGSGPVEGGEFLVSGVLIGVGLLAGLELGWILVHVVFLNMG